MASFPPKVLGTTTSCGACPNYVYYSGGVHVCRLVDEPVCDKDTVAAFCPLPDYPSHKIATMETTIMGLREPQKYNLGFALMSFIATKLKLTLEPNGSGMVIPFKDGKKERAVYLGIDYIKDIDALGSQITFTGEESTFKLDLNTPPLLREQADEKGDLWHQHQLAA